MLQLLTKEWMESAEGQDTLQGINTRRREIAAEIFNQAFKNG